MTAVDEPLIPSAAMPKLRWLWGAAVFVTLVAYIALPSHGRAAWPPRSRAATTETSFHEHQGSQQWTVLITNAARRGRTTQCLAMSVTSSSGVVRSSCGFFASSNSRTFPNNEIVPLAQGTLALGPTPSSVAVVRYFYWVARGGVLCAQPVGRGWVKESVAATTRPLPSGPERGRWYEAVLPTSDRCFYSFTYSDRHGAPVRPTRF